MNRPAIILLLALSLGGNALFAFLYFRRAENPTSPTISPAHAAAPAAASARTTSTTSAADLAKLGQRVAAARYEDDFRSLAADLRAAGMPESLVILVLQSAVQQEHRRRRTAIFDFASLPYWKNVQPSAAQQRALRAVEREMRETLASLGLPPLPEQVHNRQRQFGNLPEAKISEIERIQQDYWDLRTELMEQQRQNPRGQDVAAQLRMIAAEQDRDIAALLTPDEKLEFDLRNSPASMQLRGVLQNIDATEEEYRAIYPAYAAYMATTFNSFGPAADPRSQQSALAKWDEFAATARNNMDPDRYRQFLIASNVVPNAAPFFNARPDITVQQIESVVRMSRSLSVEMQAEATAPGVSSEERRARVAALGQRYRDQATQLLGPQYAQELFSQNVIVLPRSDGSVPAFRLPGGG